MTKKRERITKPKKSMEYQSKRYQTFLKSNQSNSLLMPNKKYQNLKFNIKSKSKNVQTSEKVLKGLYQICQV